MARPLRIERVGAWYHITGRGNDRRPVFRDDHDRQHFCELEYVEPAVREGLERTPWEELREQVALGSGKFVEMLRRSVKGSAVSGVCRQLVRGWKR
jgi:hypothetical protein